jgi:hypothetical protein
MADQARLKAVLPAIKNVSPKKLTALSVVQSRYSPSEFNLSLKVIKDEKKLACARRTFLADFSLSPNPGICCRMEADS